MSRFIITTIIAVIIFESITMISKRRLSVLMVFCLSLFTGGMPGDVGRSSLFRLVLFHLVLGG